MRHYALDTIEPKRKAAQEIVCQCAFYACCAIVVGLFVAAIALPTVVDVNVKTCYICMSMELLAIVFAYVAYWIKRYTL